MNDDKKLKEEKTLLYILIIIITFALFAIFYFSTKIVLSNYWQHKTGKDIGDLTNKFNEQKDILTEERDSLK